MKATLLLLALSAGASAAPARLKELVDVEGVRENPIYGYGLVVGLNGTGDSERVLFTSQSVSGMLGRLGVRVDPRDARSRNVAAVIVTARLATFVRPGSRIDVSVSALGDSRSLEGGVLMVTPLAGPDGLVYAVAQGAVQVGGYEASAAGSSARKNQPNTGAVPGGATVERLVAPVFTGGLLRLSLKRPDFTNASRVAQAITAALGEGTARAVDPVLVEVKPPESLQDPVLLLARLELLEVNADARAKIVVSERTGTVVAGAQVRLGPALVSHGGLQVQIDQRLSTSQPSAFGKGRTVSAPVADVRAAEGISPAVAMAGAASVQDLAKALNALGATPRDLISILQALKAAGALDADLEVL